MLLPPGFITAFAAQGAEGGGLGTSTAGRAPGAGPQAHRDELGVPRLDRGMPGNHGGEEPDGVKSIWCESCLHKLKLIGVVALINFVFGRAQSIGE